MFSFEHTVPFLNIQPVLVFHIHASLRGCWWTGRDPVCCFRCHFILLFIQTLLSLGSWQTPTLLNTFFNATRNSRLRMEYMIGFHIAVRKKMHDVARTASAGTSTPGTKLRKKPIIQVGRKHTKNVVMMMETSTAAFRSLICLDISWCWGLSASTWLPTWTSMAFI